MKEAKLHITDEEMQLYIRNKLSDHHRQRVELEIQLCEACLERFIYWNSKEELSSIPQSEHAAEQISLVIQSEQKRGKRKWIQRPFAQVAVAASITLLLVGSGALSFISSSLSMLEEQRLQHQIEQKIDDEQSPISEEELDQHSHSERWMNKAKSWIEKLHSIRFDK